MKKRIIATFLSVMMAASVLVGCGSDNIFRDSFGSSIAPLLSEGYAKITLVDIRYLRADLLERFIEFKNQDVLFLYSTSVLNHSETLT